MKAKYKRYVAIVFAGLHLLLMLLQLILGQITAALVPLVTAIIFLWLAEPPAKTVPNLTEES